MLGRSLASLSRNPGHEQFQKAFLVRMQADLGVWNSLDWPGEPLVIHLQPHRRGWTQIGTDRIGYSDRVEERGRPPFLRPGPLVIKQGQLIGQRRAVGEDRPQGRILQVDLCRIERLDEDRHAGSEQRPGPRRIALNVPLGRGLCSAPCSPS